MVKEIIENKTVEIPVEQGTTEQKLTAIVKYLHNQNDLIKIQNEHLKTIRSSVNFFVILTVLSMVIAFFTWIL
jgi:hypothetical protein